MFRYFYGNTVKILFKIRKDLRTRLKITINSHGLRKSLKW